jgi:hypothetical protein
VAHDGDDAGTVASYAVSSSPSVDSSPAGDCEAHALAQYGCFSPQRACASGRFDPEPLVSALAPRVHCCAYQVRATYGAVILHLQVTGVAVESIAIEPRPGAASDSAFLSCIERASRSIRMTRAVSPVKVTWPFRLVGGGCLIQ